MSQERKSVIPSKIRYFTEQIRTLKQYEESILSEQDVLYMKQHNKSDDSIKMDSNSTEVNKNNSFIPTFFDDSKLAEFVYPEKPNVTSLPSLFESLGKYMKL